MYPPALWHLVPHCLRHTNSFPSRRTLFVSSEWSSEWFFYALVWYESIGTAWTWETTMSYPPFNDRVLQMLYVDCTLQLFFCSVNSTKCIRQLAMYHTCQREFICCHFSQWSEQFDTSIGAGDYCPSNAELPPVSVDFVAKNVSIAEVCTYLIAVRTVNIVFAMVVSAVVNIYIYIYIYTH